MAFEVSGGGDKLSLIPTWISRDMQVPDPLVVANGVVYAIQTGENTVQNPGRAATSGLNRPPPAGGRPRTATPADQLAPRRKSRLARAAVRAGVAELTPRGGAGRSQARATPVTNLVLYAFDAQTGNSYSSGMIIKAGCTTASRSLPKAKSSSTWDAHVYAFGLKR